MKNKFKKQNIWVGDTESAATKMLGKNYLFVTPGVQDKYIYLCFKHVNIQITQYGVSVYYEK